MSAAAPLTAADVSAFMRRNCIPRGYVYTLVWISQLKRDLQIDLVAAGRLQLLDAIESTRDVWLSSDMVAAINPMCSDAAKMADEARKLGDGAFDVYAEHFPTFAILNPSLIGSLEMLPAALKLRA